MFNISEKLEKMRWIDESPPKKISDRAIALSKIAELTGMTEILDKNYWAFAGRFNHLKGVEGTKILNWMYETAMCESGEEDGKWRRIKFWQLLEETRNVGS